MADKADSIEAGQPALSYLSLVERNNELLQRLVDALAGYEIPEEWRPLHPGWQWVSPALPSRSTAMGLQVSIFAGPAGITIQLRNWMSDVLRQVVWSYDGVPLPGYGQ